METQHYLNIALIIVSTLLMFACWLIYLLLSQSDNHHRVTEEGYIHFLGNGRIRIDDGMDNSFEYTFKN